MQLKPVSQLFRTGLSDRILAAHAAVGALGDSLCVQSGEDGRIGSKGRRFSNNYPILHQTFECFLALCAVFSVMWTVPEKRLSKIFPLQSQNREWVVNFLHLHGTPPKG